MKSEMRRPRTREQIRRARAHNLIMAMAFITICVIVALLFRVIWTKAAEPEEEQAEIVHTVQERKPTMTAQVLSAEVDVVVEEAPKSLGKFKITVYTPYSDGGIWGYQTATGVTSEHLKTCAVDPDVIPLGTIVEVNGLKLKAVDTGSAVKGNVIDIFYDGGDSIALDWICGFGTVHEVFEG